MAGGDGEPTRRQEGRKEQGMLVRVMGSTVALLSFAVVCFSGLLQGNSFVSVIRRSLVALGIGGVLGIVVAAVIRVVVTEHFADQQARGEDDQGRPAAAGDAGRANQTGKLAAEASGEKASGAATTKVSS